MRDLLGLCLMAYMLAACTSDVEEIPAETRAINLGNKSYRITLPKNPNLLITRVPFVEDGVKVDFQPGRRQPRYLRLTLPAKTAPSSGRTAKIGNGGRLSYSLDDSGGGSGGTEVVLAGRLEFRDHALGIECRMQAEWYTLSDGEWCLQWLRTLTPAP